MIRRCGHWCRIARLTIVDLFQGPITIFRFALFAYENVEQKNKMSN